VCVRPATHPAQSLLATHHGSLQRLARRISLCEADADDALQRATVILLTRPPECPDRLAAWLHVVTRREALAVRRERERLLGAPLGEALPGVTPCPSERAERQDRMRLLADLKPDERRALVLRACGYSYLEIGELTGWTHTKVNRCLAEGSARLRQLGG
jgi:RNA polymerase sigma factor (sigma-70 family)